MSKAPQIDVINELLEECLMAFPISSLLIGLYQQYQKRGFLTKKQLQALYIKASKVPSVNSGKLATLEAIIKKMPNRFKSELPQPSPVSEKNAETGHIIDSILKQYPQHKRVLFLKSKFDHNEPLSSTETEELKRFLKLLK